MKTKDAWKVCAGLMVLLHLMAPARSSLAQTPEVLAEAALDGLQLELYTAIKKPFGLDGRDKLFRFMDDDQLNTITGPLTFGPWEASKGSRLQKDEYVLGFLIRNANGDVPTSVHRLASAFRATTEDGEVESYWPRGEENPLSEINAYQWEYRLAPLVIQVPKGTQRIEKLEGAIVQIPQDTTVIKLTKQDIASGAAAYARQVAVFCAGVERSAKGTKYGFLVCRSEKGTAVTSRRDSRARPIESVELLVAGKTSYGERVLPNLRSQVGIDSGTRRKLITDVVAKTRKQPTTSALEEAMLAVLLDPKAEFSLLNVGFSGEKIEFDEIEVSVNVTTGLPKLFAFTIGKITLPTLVDEAAINDFVNSLPVEEQAGIKSPLEFRTWRDATGSFSLEAKLLGIEAGSVQLEKKDGGSIQVPAAKLSQADRDYISNLSP